MVQQVARTTLITIDKDVSLGTNYTSQILDLREMNAAFFQVVTTSAPDFLDGKFELKVSLICDETTFLVHPDSERTLNASCNNFGWAFCCIPWRYAIICYTSNSVTTGIFDLYARAKLT